MDSKTVLKIASIVLTVLGGTLGIAENYVGTETMKNEVHDEVTKQVTKALSETTKES